MYGVEKLICARMAYEALMEFVYFLQTVPSGDRHLQHVHFVNIDHETTDAMARVMKSLYEMRLMFPRSVEQGKNDPSRDSDETEDINTGTEASTDVYDNDVDSIDVGLRQNKASLKQAQALKEKLCAICLEPITNAKQLDCGHIFCIDCIAEYFEKGQPKCPSCGKLYGMLKGNQPRGGMFSYRGIQRLKLAGYQHHGALEITYHIPNGIQTVSIVFYAFLTVF